MTEVSRIHVYRLPERLTHGYCFDGGHPVPFQNVDWFDMPIGEPRVTLEHYVKSKSYFDRAARFLVLSRHPDFTFTIEPVAA